MITCKVSVNVLDRGEALWNMQQKGSVIMRVRQCTELHRRSIVYQCDCECLWLCVMMQVRSCFKWGCSRDVSTIYGTVPCVCSRYGYDLLLCLLNCTLTVLNLCFL